MAKRKSQTYRPPAELLRLFPEISGNEVNGLGERDRRRPSPIFWHDPGRLAHGPLQDHVTARIREVPELANFERKFGGRGAREPTPVAPERAEDTPANRTRKVKEYALAHEADLVGIARVDPEWVFEGYTVTAAWAIVLGVAMDHVGLSRAPAVDAQVEVMTQYNRGTRAARALSNWIHDQGWPARPHGGPSAGPLNLIPAALASGFGELGKHGSIINRSWGSSFRLASVLTDLPLVADGPDTFAADDFCQSCRLCAEACPPGAIFENKQRVRGSEKWFVDFDKCIPYFCETAGCAICIAVCPWSRPGVAPRLAAKMGRRRARSGGGRG